MKAAVDLAALRRHLLQPGRLEAHTLFECSGCEEQTLGQRRCAECQRFCRALGLAAVCPHCDEPVLVAEFFGVEVPLPLLP